MIVPLEEKPLGEVTNLYDAQERLLQVMRGDLPGFIIKNVSNSAGEAVASMQSCLEAGGFKTGDRENVFHHQEPSTSRRRVIRALGPFGLLAQGRNGQVQYRSRTGLHADDVPREQTVTTILFNHTECGKAEAVFYEPTDALVQGYFDRQKSPRLRRYGQEFMEVLQGGDLEELHLTTRVLKQLHGNRVDNQFLVPVKYTAMLGVGSTVVFRAGGRKPLFHAFQSIERPRLSRVRGASLQTEQM